MGFSTCYRVTGVGWGGWTTTTRHDRRKDPGRWVLVTRFKSSQRSLGVRSVEVVLRVDYLRSLSVDGGSVRTRGSESRISCVCIETRVPVVDGGPVSLVVRCSALEVWNHSSYRDSWGLGPSGVRGGTLQD